MTTFSLERYCFIQDKNNDDLFVGKVLLHHQSLVPLRVNVAVPEKQYVCFDLVKLNKNEIMTYSK
jgi:hypothetical protein